MPEPELRLVTDQVPPRPPSLQLEDFSDVELLHLVLDYQDKDGYVTTGEMVLAIGIDSEHARNCVSSRFSWLKRYGAMEKHPEETNKWRLSAAGRALIGAKLSASEQRLLESMKDEKLLGMARVVTSRYRAAGSVSAQMVRREWIYGTSKRRFQ